MERDNRDTVNAADTVNTVNTADTADTVNTEKQNTERAGGGPATGNHAVAAKAAGRRNAKQTMGNLLIVLGILLLMSAVSLVVYNKIEDMKAGRASDEVLSKFTSAALIPAPVASLYDQMNMMVEKIDGEEYIGILSIPAYDLLLPVNAKADLTRLQFSPCYYFGNYKEDNMVICAHNFYKHFGYLLQIAPGEEVIFISADGYIYKYLVAYSETVMPTEVDRMVGTDEEKKDWDLTLFTCNWGGASRRAIRCTRVKFE